MKPLKYLLAGLVGLVVLLCIVGFFLPDTAHVERSVDIKAPQARVFATLNGFARFNDWSPWFAMDPKAQYRFSGPATGVGAKMAWVSDELGSGSQEILGVDGAELITLRLDFGDQGKADAFYKLSPIDAENTRITWGFDSHAEGKLINRYFNLIMDSMVGADYEKGLAKLKTVLEQPAP